MSDKLATIKQLQQEVQTEEQRKQVSVLRQVLEPLSDAVEELTETLIKIKKDKVEGVEYYDKGLGSTLSSSLDKIFGLLQNFKQAKIDLSPITVIATEIKTQNTSLLNLVNNLSKESNKVATENLIKEVVAMVQRNNEFITKGLQQVDYSEEINSIAAKIEANKPSRNFEFEVVRGNKYGSNLIEKVIVKSK